MYFVFCCFTESDFWLDFCEWCLFFVYSADKREVEDLCDGNEDSFLCCVLCFFYLFAVVLCAGELGQLKNIVE